MNFPRLAGLIALAALALAAPVSASTPTSPAGTAYTGLIKGHSQAPHVLIHKNNASTITCESSSFELALESHGPSLTTKGSFTSLNFGSCGPTVTVLKRGTVEIHKGSSGLLNWDDVTWSGFEITVAWPMNPDCKYFYQEPTSIFMGGLTTSASLGGATATLDLDTLRIPVGNSILCPAWIEFTGAYTITTPDYLSLDG